MDKTPYFDVVAALAQEEVFIGASRVAQRAQTSPKASPKTSPKTSSVTSFIVDPTQEWLSTDSRHLADHAVFMPLAGKNYDGHDFIAAAVQQGVRGFFYEPKRYDIKAMRKEIDEQGEQGEPVEVVAIAVRCSKEAYCVLSRVYRRQILKHTTVIAITGSSGKTTLKEYVKKWLMELMGQGHVVAATVNNENNEIGVAKTLLQTHPTTNDLIVEMGMRHKGDIAFLLKMACPQVCVLTCVYPSHLQAIRSLDNLYAGKLEMFHHSKQAKWVGWMDDERIRQVMLSHDQSYGFGVCKEAQVCIQHSHLDVAARSTTVEMNIASKLASLYHLADKLGDTVSVTVTVKGVHQSTSLHVAAACAVILALGRGEALQARSELKLLPLNGRFCLLSSPLGVTVVDDSYNAHLQSMRAGLLSFHKLAARATKVLILADMLDLGAASGTLHGLLGEWIAERFSFKDTSLLLVGAAMKAGFARVSGLENACIHYYPKVDDLLSSEVYRDYMTQWLEYGGQWVYIKGSRGMKLDKVADDMVASLNLE
ncbi:MAG: UDP-N-acetylmuramoyl-tripeptide--D-alanyl-D-alanine ligase [Proteobacteria bacterium]|nr:UDP-N-acetylmuramoyl-tripeptide--D-alanyl-D-alanine ligase [Pseudomonadota bacterium]